MVTIEMSDRQAVIIRNLLRTAAQDCHNRAFRFDETNQPTLANGSAEMGTVADTVAADIAIKLIALKE